MNLGRVLAWVIARGLARWENKRPNVNQIKHKQHADITNFYLCPNFVHDSVIIRY